MKIVLDESMKNMKKKGQIEFEMLVKIVVVIVLALVVIAAIVTLRGKGTHIQAKFPFT